MAVAYDPSSLALIKALVANRPRLLPAKEPGSSIDSAKKPSSKRIGRPSSLSRNDPDVTRMVNDRLARPAQP